MSISATLLVIALGLFIISQHTKSLEHDLVGRMHIMTDDIIEHDLYTLTPSALNEFFLSNRSYHKDSYGKYMKEITFRYGDKVDENLSTLSVSKILPNKKYLIISSSSNRIDKEIKELLVRVIFGLVVILGLILLGLHLLLKKLLHPLKCLVNYCNDSSLELPLCSGSYEIDALKEAILGLEKSNTVLCKEKQDIFKEAAHEIKTPIAILKARLALYDKSDMSKDEFILESKNDIYTISNKLRELIFLKAIEWDIQQSKQSVQMQSQCSMMQQLFRPILEKKELEMVSNLQEDFTLYIHREAIGRVMQAIFENIFMYTKNGTTIQTYIDSKKNELRIVNEIAENSEEILFSSHIGSKLIERLADKLEYEYTTSSDGNLFHTTIIFKGQAPS